MSFMSKQQEKRRDHYDLVKFYAKKINDLDVKTCVSEYSKIENIHELHRFLKRWNDYDTSRHVIFVDNPLQEAIPDPGEDLINFSENPFPKDFDLGENQVHSWDEYYAITGDEYDLKTVQEIIKEFRDNDDR